MPITDIDAQTAATGLIHIWISRFDVPLRITTNQGRQFESCLFKELARSIGATHLRTTAYHPQANGMVECFHRQLKAAIKCHETEDWVEILPIVLLGIRSAYKEDLSTSAAEMLYGNGLRLPGELFESNRNEDLATSPYVFLRHDAVKGPLQPSYDGPLKVLQRDDKTFTLEIKGKEVKVSVDCLKPTFIMTDDGDYPHVEQRHDSNARNNNECSNAPTTRQDQDTTTTTDYKTRSGRRVRFPERLQEEKYFLCSHGVHFILIPFCSAL
ncbi:uncharacterized protein LOC143431630 [Xylocopa sonorina]|uniref:uncharacterized protein LOC143431630 n=1 Tax=Xylocopa sonorina TaxID=1818115 RepID=UPI00403ACE37